MEIGQELTHTVTTSITAEKQTVTNETQLIDGGDTVLKTMQTVSLPVGNTYNIDTKGDINSQTIKRILNMANNMVGVNAFTFENSSDSTDTDNLKLTATYDAETFLFSGTAPLESVVRIIFEDGSSVKISPDSLGNWQYVIAEDKLQYGTNNVSVITGANDGQIVMLDIEREQPVTPFDTTFSAVLSANGRVVSGTVVDTRAIIAVQVGTDVFSVIPRVDSTWSYNFDTALTHGDTVDVSVAYQGTTSAVTTLSYFVNAAQLDQITGQYISGTSAPFESVTVATSKYGSATVQADSDGEWQLDFATGLPTGATVIVTINGTELPILTYVGADNVDFTLSVKIVDSTHIQGMAEPNTDITVTAGQSADMTATSDATGHWSVLLAEPLDNLASVLVGDGSTTATATYVYFSAKIITKTQLEGVAVAGSVVSADGIETVAKQDNTWKLILLNALELNEVVTVANGENQVNVTYIPEFTAYISGDGLSVLGTSSENQVTVSINGADPEAVNVVNGEWIYSIASALASNDTVKVVSGEDEKVMTYVVVTEFTAVLSESKNTVTGTVDAAAKLRVVFEDNSMIDADVAQGNYSLPLERTLVAGEPIVVACIVNNAIYTTITLYA